MPARRKPISRPAFEPLEGRALLSDGVSARLARGVLLVVGTESADVIRVEAQSSTGRPRGRPGFPGLIVVEGSRPFPAVLVRRLVVEGLGGDDAIEVDLGEGGRTSIRVSGGAGNDRIDVRGGGEARIDGGPGENIINGAWDRPPAPAGASLDESGEIVALANAERVEAGLPPLATSDALEEAARLQAEAMARLDRIDHNLPGAEFPTLSDRAEAAGYAYAMLAENIAFNYPDGPAVMGGWMGSPGHRANLLDPGVTEAGVAVARNASGEPYHALVLGRPA